MKNYKNILVMVVSAILSLMIFTGCEKSLMIDFQIGNAWPNHYDKEIVTIINSLNDITDGNIGRHHKNNVSSEVDCFPLHLTRLL